MKSANNFINTTEINKNSKDISDSEVKRVKIKDKSVTRRRIFLSRLKRRILKHIWLVRIGIGLSVLAGLSIIFLLSFFVLSRTVFDRYFGLVGDFIFTPKSKVRVFSGKVNFLILGKGGQNHNAPDLTDTIIFMSIGFENPSVDLISIPRDIWIAPLRAKLNSMYYWGNQKEEGGGLKLAKSSAEEIVGQPVSYGIVVDFEGFREIVDVLGGVEVDVERSFVDKKFPIPSMENDECDGDPEYKCRYETLRFTQGKQLMDGETALKYARSRNAEGDEGTDIARERRQQKIILAIKNKMVSSEVVFSPKKIARLKEVVLRNMETDVDFSTAVILARKILSGKDNFSSHVLPQEYLENPAKSPRYDNLYVFVAKSGSWDKVHGWVECILSIRQCD